MIRALSYPWVQGKCESDEAALVHGNKVSAKNQGKTEPQNGLIKTRSTKTQISNMSHFQVDTSVFAIIGYILGYIHRFPWDMHCNGTRSDRGSEKDNGNKRNIIIHLFCQQVIHVARHSQCPCRRVILSIDSNSPLLNLSVSASHLYVMNVPLSRCLQIIIRTIYTGANR